LGLGIVPWSPLKFGILSGKYTRSNRESVQPGRGEWVKGLLAEERTYEILDVLFEVAREATRRRHASLSTGCFVSLA